MSFDWAIDKYLALPAGNEVHILRRSSSGKEEWKQDLRPFEDIPAMWKLRGDDRTDLTTIGTLRCIKNYADHDEYHLLRETGLELKISLPVPLSRELTIWRVNERLDMLQVSVRCVDAEVSLYAQLGGATILPLLLSEGFTDESLLIAKSLFRSGELGDRISNG